MKTDYIFSIDFLLDGIVLLILALISMVMAFGIVYLIYYIFHKII